MANYGQTAKHQKKELVYQVIKRQPLGITEQEIANALNMGDKRRTINNYLRDLEQEGKVYKEDNSTLWMALPYESVKLRGLELSPEEAMTLYLAVRLLVKQNDKRNEAAQLALTRLAEILTGDAKVGHEIYQAALELSNRPGDEQYARVFRTMMQAYIYRRKVEIVYKPLNEKPFETTFAPYLFEPSTIGFAVYVIGHSSRVNDRRTYKLQRIQRATLTREEYAIPAEFPGLDILRSAWSIIHGEQRIEVKLRFSSDVAERVKESQWHPSQKPIVDDPDKPGWVQWMATVADLTDLVPWVRSWGADCEVLAPEGLRKSIISHVWKLAQTYNLTTQSDNIDTRLLRLWGKTTKDSEIFHPALCHMFDVAHVAQQLLSPRASSRWRRVLAEALKTEAETLYEWLPYVIALHDIGKVSVPFQVLNRDQQSRLRSEGFNLGQANQKDGRELHHSLVGQLVLQEFVTDWPENLKAAFLEMVSGHHGVFQNAKRSHQQDFQRIKEVEEWSRLRQQAITILRSYLCGQWPDPLPNPSNQSAAIMALNGFCILCDWLGSDEAYFTPEPLTSLTDYIPKSRERAYRRVRDAGFFEQVITVAPTKFTELFTDILEARPLQAAIDAIPDDLLRQQTLTIMEAPTGEGKTEAALTLARRIGAWRGTDEMYIALPTTATSNAMFERLQIHLVERLGLPQELVRLIHGQDFLADHDLPTQPMQSVEPGEEAPSESPALSWFAPKKKALLAPIGVGTIDQAELSALNVRHNALRMIGLAGKTIILDEVHAYDTYMTTIIKRMLTWLSALGSSVILLSATLPQARRQELAQAFAGIDEAVGLELNAYPSLLTIGPAGHYFCTPAAYQPDKIIHLRLVQFVADEVQTEAEKKANWLLEQVQNGGCACWMTNTVKRAQQIYDALLKNAPAEVDLELFHARFPLAEREERERAIMRKYSKKGQRPFKGIVVGTQVLEQSLDLDFDVLMTDLAPIDLILQRAGRLHRHDREAATRYDHKEPHLYINTVIEAADKKVYDDYILQKSRQTLEQITATRQALTLPADYRPLIETVYDETEPVGDDPLYEAWDKLDTKKINLEDEANLRLAALPDPDYPFYRGAKPRDFREDEESSGWLVAPTRWGADSITVVPLVRNGELAQTVTGDVAVTSQQKTDRDTQRKLLRQSLRLSHKALVAYFRQEFVSCPLFTDSALLKNVFPLWLKADEIGFVGQDLPVEVRLHPALGLVIGSLESKRQTGY